jgi:hypothetical protein
MFDYGYYLIPPALAAAIVLVAFLLDRRRGRPN